jgi:hypothetical protein
VEPLIAAAASDDLAEVKAALDAECDELVNDPG